MSAEQGRLPGEVSVREFRGATKAICQSSCARRQQGVGSLVQRIGERPEPFSAEFGEAQPCFFDGRVSREVRLLVGSERRSHYENYLMRRDGTRHPS